MMLLADYAVALLAVMGGAALGLAFGLVYFKAKFRSWILDKEAEIREDAIGRSRSSVTGRVAEQLAPLLPNFLSKYNPKDARFLGSPVDLVVFDGLDEGRLKGVVFIEVKTGSSGFTHRERQVRDAVRAKLVSWELLSER